jgi:hyperosmotically inducible protein
VVERRAVKHNIDALPGYGRAHVGWRTEYRRVNAHTTVSSHDHVSIGKIMFAYSSRIACIGAIAAGTIITSLSACSNGTGASDAAPPSTIGTAIDDAVVATKVRSALVSTDDIKSLDIKVTVNKGIVLLSGFVDNQAQMERGVAVASAIEGVKSVDNKLSQKDGKQTVGNKVDDSVITAGVKSAMLGDTVMKSGDVSVTTRKGEVELSGFVDNEIQLAHAMDVAKAVDGVASVVNHMTVKQ